MKKHRPLKRVLALVLSCLMALSLLPGAEAWCLEPGVPLNTGTTLTTDAVRTWISLSASQQEAVKLVTALYRTASLSGTEGEQNVAAQLLIW